MIESHLVIKCGNYIYRNIRPASTSSRSVRIVPVPRPPYGTVQEFLKAIGRNCDSFSKKFDSWDSLFLADSQKLNDLGIGIRERKFILAWTHKYTLGIDPYYIPPSKKSIAKGRWKP